MNSGVQKIIFEYIHIFCIYFHRCFITQVISAQSVLATREAPTREALAVHARTCPGLPENRKRQLCDEFRDTTPPPKKRKTSIYSFLYSF